MNKPRKRFHKYRQSLEDGKNFQDYIAGVLGRYGLSVRFREGYFLQVTCGESYCGLEVKLDRKYPYEDDRTLFMETNILTRRGEWVPSGMLASNLDHLYLIGNYEEGFFIFRKPMLVELWRTDRCRTVHTHPREGEDLKARGMSMPEAQALRLCIEKWENERPVAGYTRLRQCHCELLYVDCCPEGHVSFGRRTDGG